MKAIIVGGNELGDTTWMKRAPEEMKWLFKPVTVFSYLEAASLAETMATEADRYTLIAKSAGCWVALEAMKQRRPTRAILIGVPEPVHNQLHEYNGPPTLFIQQRGDGLDNLRQIVEGTNVNARVIGIPDQGDYERLDTITSVIGSWHSGS